MYDSASPLRDVVDGATLKSERICINACSSLPLKVSHFDDGEEILRFDDGKRDSCNYIFNSRKNLKLR